MRIALFSDVHSNLPALEAVLDDIGALRVDARFVLGDLVGYALAQRGPRATPGRRPPGRHGPAHAVAGAECSPEVDLVGTSKDLAALHEWAWLGNQDAAGSPTVWRGPVR